MKMTLQYFIQLKLPGENKTFKTKVSTEGCSDIADFKVAIKTKFSPLLDSYDAAQLSLFQPDDNGITDKIDPGVEF